MKSKTPIGEQDVRNAIRKYLKTGGIIHKLPDEKCIKIKKVGGKWNNSEIEMKQFG